MLRAYRIAIVDANQRSRTKAAAWLSRAGHLVLVQAESIAELNDKCRDVEVDLIVADVQQPGQQGLEAAREMSLHFDLPVIALSKGFDEQAIESECCSHVFAHLMKPLRENELLAAVPLAVYHYRELRALQNETENARRALDERKFIERAKGVIMRNQTTDEASAFRQLQHLARNHRLKMADVAKSIVLAQEALDSPIPTIARAPSVSHAKLLPHRKSC